jgi:hypothetical protein
VDSAWWQLPNNNRPIKEARAFGTGSSVENARDVSKTTIAENVAIARIKPSLVGKIGFDRNVYTGVASWTLTVDGVKTTITTATTTPITTATPTTIATTITATTTASLMGAIPLQGRVPVLMLFTAA